MATYKLKGIKSIVGSVLSLFWCGVLAFAYPGIMSVHWQQQFNVGASATGVVVTAILFAQGGLMFFAGKAHTSIGTKKAFIIGAMFQAISLTTLIFATSIQMVWLFAALAGVASCFIYNPAITTVQAWFPNKRGFVSGILFLTWGLSSAIFSPILTIMINNIGITGTNIIVGVCTVTSLLAASFITEVPSKSNMTQSQTDEFNAACSCAASGAKTPGKEYTLQQAIKTKQFWMIWLSWVFMGAAGSSMLSLTGEYSREIGINSVVAVTAFNFTNGFGRIISGTLSDKIGRNTAASSAFIIAGAAYIILPFTSSQVVVALLMAMVGYGFGTLFSVSAPLVSDLFGLKNFGVIFGITFTAYGFVASFIGPALSGIILGATSNNFVVVFGYLGIFAIIGAFFINAAKKPKKL